MLHLFSLVFPRIFIVEHHLSRFYACHNLGLHLYVVWVSRHTGHEFLFLQQVVLALACFNISEICKTL